MPQLPQFDLKLMLQDSGLFALFLAAVCGDPLIPSDFCQQRPVGSKVTKVSTRVKHNGKVQNENIKGFKPFKTWGKMGGKVCLSIRFRLNKG